MDGSTEKKLKILVDVFGDYVTEKDERLFHCPKCHHRKHKLSINIDKGVFQCWVCGFHGNNQNLLRKHGKPEQVREWKALEGEQSKPLVRRGKDNRPVVSLPRGSMVLKTGMPDMHSKHALAFMQKRGVPYNLIRTFDVRYCDKGFYANRVVFPSYDIRGSINFFVTRAFFNSDMPYLNAPVSKDEIIFNELFVTWERPVFLVEGIFDSLAVLNSVPLLGSSMSHSSLLFRRLVEYKPEVVLMLDNDRAGKKGTAQIGQLLLDHSLTVKHIPYTGKDPASIPKQEIAKVLANRKKFTRLDILRKVLE